LELFKSRAYRVQVAGTLTPLQREALQEEFALVEIAEDSERTYIDVQLPGSEDIYELIGILREGRSVIEAIDRQDPDLEEIFLRMVAGETHHETLKESLVKTRGGSPA
jgi:hypothetical protein